MRGEGEGGGTYVAESSTGASFTFNTFTVTARATDTRPSDTTAVSV
jgi:hypothetical protein